MRTILLTLTSLCFLAINTSAQTPELPSMECKTMAGETVDIEDQVKKGQITVIAFWASWCSPIKKELEVIDEVYEEWKDEYDLELIAVSLDDARTLPKAKELIAYKGWQYTALFAHMGRSGEAFGFNNIPYLVLVDQSGNIVYTHKGYAPGDEDELEEEIKKIAQE